MTPRQLTRRLKLSLVERQILMLYYAEELSLAEVAAVLGMAAFRVESMRRQIVTRARDELGVTVNRAPK